MQKLDYKAVLCAIFCNLLFGSAFPMIKLGYEHFGISDSVFSKILYAGVRFLVSGIILWIFTLCMDKKAPKISRSNTCNVLVLAITYTFLQYIFFYIGLANTKGAIGSVLNSTSVFISVILAHFIYPDDKLNMRKISGAIIGFIGVGLACITQDSLALFSFMGEGFILIGAMFFVIGSVFNKSAAKVDGSFAVSAYNLIIGGGLLSIIGLIGFDGQLTFTLSGFLVLLYLCFVSTVGFTMWSMLLKKYPIGKLSVYNFVIPVSGTLFSAIVLGENVFTWWYGLAILLLSLGIVLVNYNAKKR